MIANLWEPLGGTPTALMSAREIIACFGPLPGLFSQTFAFNLQRLYVFSLQYTANIVVCLLIYFHHKFIMSYISLYVCISLYTMNIVFLYVSIRTLFS